MGIEDRIERLRDIYGPPPLAPLHLSNWIYSIDLIAELPDRVAERPAIEGSENQELNEILGSLAPAIIGDIVWRNLQSTFDKIRMVAVAVEAIEQDELCRVLVFGWSDDRRSTLASQIAAVAVRSVTRMLLTDPVYYGLFQNLL